VGGSTRLGRFLDIPDRELAVGPESNSDLTCHYFDNNGRLCISLPSLWLVKKSNRVLDLQMKTKEFRISDFVVR